MVEYDAREGVAFGYTCLNGDEQNAEWGYQRLPKLESLYRPPFLLFERDLYWTPCRVAEAKLPGTHFKVEAKDEVDRAPDPSPEPVAPKRRQSPLTPSPEPDVGKAGNYLLF